MNVLSLDKLMMSVLPRVVPEVGKVVRAHNSCYKDHWGTVVRLLGQVSLHLHGLMLTLINDYLTLQG